ncbi:MAG: recombination-associated protein RdgC [Desulfovibrio sp.]|jgi:hypothetical protein|nr:recombination-associated protein RdgC [Desulfovibrio sp.]
MGFMNSSCSFTRFRIMDPVPEALWREIPDRLKQHAFVDIDATPEMHSHGWVCFDDMLDVEWMTAPPQKGALYTFSLRVDTRRIPAGVIKKHLAIALQEEKERQGASGKKFVSKERKKELKEEVLLALRGRFLPVPAEFNVFWEEDRVWFASVQGKMLDLFMDFFHETFGLTLEQMTPYMLASTILDEDGMTELDRIEPAVFADEED